MPVATAPLVDRLVAAVVPPGSSADLFADAENGEEAWLLVLANAFWRARLKRFFTDYRLSNDYTSIVTVVGTEDMPDELQQVIIAVAAIDVILAKMMETSTVFRAKSGDEEFETQQSATVLKALLDARLADLAELKDVLVDADRSGTTVGLIDLVLERNNYGTAWVGA